MHERVLAADAVAGDSGEDGNGGMPGHLMLGGNRVCRKLLGMPLSGYPRQSLPELHPRDGPEQSDDDGNDDDVGDTDTDTPVLEVVAGSLSVSCGDERNATSPDLLPLLRLPPSPPPPRPGNHPRNYPLRLQLVEMVDFVTVGIRGGGGGGGKLGVLCCSVRVASDSDESSVLGHGDGCVNAAGVVRRTQQQQQRSELKRREGGGHESVSPPDSGSSCCSQLLHHSQSVSLDLRPAGVVGIAPGRHRCVDPGVHPKPHPDGTEEMMNGGASDCSSLGSALRIPIRLANGAKPSRPSGPGGWNALWERFRIGKKG